jgi:hypothetical protein
LLQDFGVCTHLWLLEQLHSEDIWHKVFLHSDSKTKPCDKVRGVTRKKPHGLNTLLLLVVAVVGWQVAVLVVCFKVFILLPRVHQLL